MTSHTIHFYTEADWANHLIEADTPQQALAVAQRIADGDDFWRLDFQSYDNTASVEHIEIFDERGLPVADWKSRQLRLRLAAPKLFEALEKAVEALNTVPRFKVPGLIPTATPSRRCATLARRRRDLLSDHHRHAFAGQPLPFGGAASALARRARTCAAADPAPDSERVLSDAARGGSSASVGRRIRRLDLGTGLRRRSDCESSVGRRPRRRQHGSLRLRVRRIRRRLSDRADAARSPYRHQSALWARTGRRLHAEGAIADPADRRKARLAVEPVFALPPRPHRALAARAAGAKSTRSTAWCAGRSIATGMPLNFSQQYGRTKEP